MPVDHGKLKEYLLGSINSDESERIDLKIIEDDDLFDGLSCAESELIEDYLEDTLSAEDRTLFLNNFLTSNDRRESLKEIVRLKEYASAHQSEAEKAVDANAHFFPSLASWFFVNLRPVGAVAAIAIVAGGLILWQLQRQQNLSPLESEYASLNRKDLSDLNDYRNLSNLSLISGTFRDPSIAGNKLLSRDLTDTVLFRLDVPQGGPQEFDAEIVRSGRTVFKLEKMGSYQNGAGREVRMLLPKAELTRGQYQVRLSDPADHETAIPYDFTVE